jgi:hypothetical protein
MTTTQVHKRIEAYDAIARATPRGKRPQYSREQAETLALTLVQTCRHCDDSYVAKRPEIRSSYCSRACKDRAARKDAASTRSAPGTGSTARGPDAALQLIHNCAHCGDPFVHVLLERDPRHCSLECHNLAQRRAERRTLVCRACKQPFETVQDHGKWAHYCSRACLQSEWIRPIERTCLQCDTLFMAIHTTRDTGDGGHRKFCSNTCRSSALRTGSLQSCANCGTGVYVRNSTGKRRSREDICCSKDCQRTYYVSTRSASYKGGKFILSATNETFIRAEREGYVGKYVGEHRIAAAKAIGRLLSRHEFVLRINRDPEDNGPENLFICSNSEFSKRRNGSLPWPHQSNLLTYR